MVVFLSCKSDTLLYLHRVQECAHIAFCENRLNIFCADHIIACTHGLLHTSALKDFADQPGVGEVFIFITKDYFCSAGILKLSTLYKLLVLYVFFLLSYCNSFLDINQVKFSFLFFGLIGKFLRMNSSCSSFSVLLYLASPTLFSGGGTGHRIIR